MASSRTGALIYSSIIPLLKALFTILLGYVLARKGMFTPVASRGASQITMNLAMPALLFSSIVPAFSPSNKSAIGPLLLSAFVYQAVGFLFGFIIREVCYVPTNFYQGIIVLTGMSNWGTLPTSIVMTITEAPPFDPNIDPALGSSFISIFVVAYHIVFWGLGAAHSLSWDFLPDVPQGEAAERRLSWKEKPIGGWVARVLRGDTPLILAVGSTGKSQAEKVKVKENSGLQQCRESSKTSSDQYYDHSLHPAVSDIHRAAHILDVSITTVRTEQSFAPVLPTFGTQSAIPVTSELHLVNSNIIPPRPELCTVRPTFSDQHGPKLQAPELIPFSLARMFRRLSTIVSPVFVTVVISIPISLLQPLKALFVDTGQVDGLNWKGPDGRPPLYFIIDTATFVGGITVPMALILLGASFARLPITRPFSRHAIPAMFAVAFSKMLLLPVIGVFMIQGMVHSGFIPGENKAERFVAMFLSGSPGAINQLIVTQMYAPDGNAGTLLAFLLVQYALMFFSSTVLAAISLALL